jgi:hypothetical protein
MPKLATLVWDGWSGFMDLCKQEQQPAIDEESAEKRTRGNWGLDYNLLGGRAEHMFRLLEALRVRFGISIVVIGHSAPDYTYYTKIDRSGAETQERRQVAWKVDVPGQLDERILRPWDEVYHLQTRPNEAGKPPKRLLFTERHMYQGYAFPSKTREGVPGPIEIPPEQGYATILKALPKGVRMPTRIMFVGEAGSGKTTLANSWPAPRLFVDMWGGCDKVGRVDGTLVETPADIQECYQILLKLKAKGGEYEPRKAAA